MAKRITIDPITRIEGHLRIDVRGRRRQGARRPGRRARCSAASSTILHRPRPARRLALHAALLRRVHDGARDRLGARRRERAQARGAAQRAVHPQPDRRSAHALHDHIVHFYHLSALDWVDVVSALKADPAKTAALAESLSDWPGNSTQADAGRARSKLTGLRRQRASSASSRTATGATRR